MKTNENLTQNPQIASYPVYNELSDTPVTYKTLEEEFTSRLALVEDLHKRFHFMICELKSAGLKSHADDSN
jgi:hypothetical protein